MPVSLYMIYTFNFLVSSSILYYQVSVPLNSLLHSVTDVEAQQMHVIK